MKAIDFFNPTPAERAWLRIELMRRAAQEYELAHNWPNAAECWAQAGDPNRAADLYLALDEPALAAPQLLAAKRYTEAEPCYRAWLISAPTTDVLAHITAHLGLCAARLCTAQATGWRSELDQAEQAIAADYQAARQLLHDERGSHGDRPALLAGQCWEALGHYGIIVQRPDLIQQGYELALTRYGDQHPTDRLRTARTYRTAIEWNHLLVADLDERLAHWQLAAAQLAWTRLRDEIECLGFVDGHHDVLHFADDDRQLAAWQKLAALDHDPHQAAIDDYLRTLAPENMVYIAAGKFMMGSADDDPDAHDNEKPQHEVWLGGYYIGRYPVTYADYAAFIEAGGYQQQQYWTSAGWAYIQRKQRTQPYFWDLIGDSFYSLQKPVVGVTWYEAIAYSVWHGGRLPSEAEWEKAASWDAVAGRKRRYPWGDIWAEGHCNIMNKLAGVRALSPVDAYVPQGDSTYGVSDLTGNVWEWCSTRWGINFSVADYGYSYTADYAREDSTGGNEMLRILRGGSWDARDIHSVRCTRRNRGNPDDWVMDRGFRLVAPRCLLVAPT